MLQNHIKADDISCLKPLRTLITRAQPTEYKKEKTGFKLYPVGTIEIKNKRMADVVEKKLKREGLTEKKKPFKKNNPSTNVSTMADYFPEDMKDFDQSENQLPDIYKEGEIDISISSYESGGLTIFLPSEFCDHKFESLFDEGTLLLALSEDVGNKVSKVNGGVKGQLQMQKNKLWGDVPFPNFSAFKMKAYWDGSGFEIEFDDEFIEKVSKQPQRAKKQKFEVENPKQEVKQEPKAEKQTIRESITAKVKYVNDFCEKYGYTPMIKDGKLKLEKYEVIE